MLVLTRKVNETIQIGEDIFVTITDLKKDKVRLGITAPNNVPVDRQEIADAKKRQKKD